MLGEAIEKPKNETAGADPAKNETLELRAAQTYTAPSAGGVGELRRTSPLVGEAVNAVNWERGLIESQPKALPGGGVSRGIAEFSEIFRYPQVLGR